MSDKTGNSKIAIGVNNLKDLFLSNTDFKFFIPDYQRPYVWDEEKIEALFKDIAEELDEETQQLTYYMGAILLHQKEGNVLEIIDGQQRITTLLILDYIINNENSLINIQENQLQLTYNSPKSKENIIRNHTYITNCKNRLLPNVRLENLLENLIFTIIVTQSEDDAFVFFDTQNNRGVKLSAVDFLKSYHLKALKGEDEETDKQKIAAMRWDKANQNQFLNKLFNVYLWRGRAWKGKEVDYENKDKVLLEFQKKTKPKPQDNSITLFANNKNSLASSITFSAKKGINMRTNNISLQADPTEYPFSFRQPVEKGMSFFLFTEKYNSLYKYIFLNQHDEGTELGKLKYFYESVYITSGFSNYFTDVFKLCLMLYYDKFEENRLYEFALWLDYLFGAYRIKQKSIVAQTPVKIIREARQNLLDIIDSAFLPDEIFEFIKSITPFVSESENSVSGDGVQGRYKRQMQLYFGETENLNLFNKENWIYAKLNHL